MKKLNLYLDFEFTSLSPDAQPISIGIVSDEVAFRFPNPEPKTVTMNDRIPISKSFYAEFTDFDINRCDDWVKENVVGKLKHYGQQPGGGFSASDDCFKYECYNDTDRIKVALKEYLEQFSDYEIQIVVDCGTWDWYWFLQLVAEWDNKELETEDSNVIFNWLNPIGFEVGGFEQPLASFKNRTGLPKLPSNISPVPFDLNDIIAIKKGISPKEAFDLSRELVAFGRPDLAEHEKHNSLFDAKIIKVIYQKLMQ